MINSQVKAKNTYRKKTRQVAVEINTETENDIIEHLLKQENKQKYIKELIRKDMERV